ncbi:MAG: ATPase, T2SS/T4P/T4SS family [bacterium]
MIGPQTVADILYNENLITKEQLNQIKFEAANLRKSIEDILISKNIVNEEAIAKARSIMYGVPYIDLMKLDITKDVLNLLSIDIYKSYSLIPFEVEQNSVKIAMSNPLDIQAIRFIEQKIGKKVSTYITTKNQINYILDNRLNEQLDNTVNTMVSEAVADSEIVDISDTEGPVNIMDIQNAPVAKIVNLILDSAVKLKASDIHIEPQKDKLRVRMRINGILMEKLQLPARLAPSLISRIKILSQLKIDERRIPQDGRFQIRSSGSEVDLRVSTLPIAYGEKVVIRLLTKTNGVVSINELGMRGRAFTNFLNALKQTTGIILVTGPTGSGKTVTLSAAINKVNSPTINIVTLEDPIEIKVDGVNQVQINTEAGLTFASGLRAFLRQDPNVIMVGEIRDEETARLATQAALTGHLVLSTIHTNGAAGSLPRLLDMGIEPYLISSTVRIALSQRLIRKICPDCIEDYIPSNEVIMNIQRVLSDVKEFDLNAFITRSKSGDGKLHLYRGRGCDKCSGAGYVSRFGIFEVMPVSDSIAKLIMQHRPASEIEQQAKAEGMVTMIQDGYLKALEGITTIDEVMRVIL